MPKKATLQQVAQLAGVSIATVSRVFAGKANISNETRQHVLKAAQSFQYTPKKYVKRARGISGSITIGVIIADLYNTFFQQIIKGITNVFDKNNINMLICNSDENPQLEIRHISTLMDCKVDGIIISPASQGASYNQEYLREIHQKDRLPVVLIDRDLRGIGLDGVFQDSFTASIKATEALIENGHKNIAIISGPTTSKPGLDRLHGFMEALREHNIAIHDEYIFYGDFKISSGYQLAQRIIKNCPEVSAIYCANNLMAIGALKALYEAGMNVPDDIAFISTGTLDSFYFLKSVPPITALDLPAEQMGYECAKLMIERLQPSSKKKKFTSKRITMDIPLKLRGSEKYPTNRL